MYDEPTPLEVASRRYVAAVGSPSAEPAPMEQSVRVRQFFEQHCHAWAGAVDDVEVNLPGWPYGDDEDAQRLEAELLELGIDRVLGEMSGSTERLCGVMLDRYLDWEASPDDEKPSITPLTRAVGSTLYYALPVSVDDLPALTIRGGDDDSAWDLDSSEFDDGDKPTSEDFFVIEPPDEEPEPDDDPRTDDTDKWEQASDPWRDPSASTGLASVDTHQQPDDDAHAEQAAIEPGGLHPVPALDSEPVSLIATAGGFFPSDWETYLRLPQRHLDGTWVLNHYPAEQKLVLQFTGRNFSAFAEIFQEHIVSAHVAGKGFNLVLEVQAADGDEFIVVGPRKRLKNIFQQLGFRL